MHIFFKRSTYVFGRRLRRFKHHGVVRVVGLLTLVFIISIPWQVLISMAYSKWITRSARSKHDATISRVIAPQPSGTPSVVVLPKTEAPQPPAYGVAAGGGLTYVGTSELDVYFQRLKDLGVGWVRWDLDWKQIQPDGPNTYNWAVADRVVTAARQYGIASLVIIDYTPSWARKPVCASSGEMCEPDDPNSFAAFARHAVDRYKDQGVHYWEIWNEPNYTPSWAPAPNVADYVSLLKGAYTAIKQSDSTATVISGGLAAVGDGDEGSYISPLTFVKEMYAQNAQQYFDAVAVHPYSFPVLPAYIADWNRWQQLVPIHDVMTQHGDLGKKVWITEFGSPTRGSGMAHSVGAGAYTYETDFMTEQAQAQIISNALSLFKQYNGWMGPFFLYTLEDNSIQHAKPADFYGLIRADGSKKPAYDAYRQVITQN